MASRRAGPVRRALEAMMDREHSEPAPPPRGRGALPARNTSISASDAKLRAPRAALLAAARLTNLPLLPSRSDPTKTPRRRAGVMYWCIGSGVVYNVSWEDCRVDCELLSIRPKQKDTVLMLTSGGCNVLDMALEGAEKVVAADLNPHQNALLELKCVAIEHLTHEEFFAIFALSDFALYKRVYAETLRARLSEPARKFWDANSGFFKNVMWGGSSGFAARTMINAARTLFGIGPLLDAVKDCETLEEQVALYRANEPRVAALCAFVNALKPAVSPFIAVPASQLALFRGDICRHVLDNLFLNTHIKKDNYFYYGYFYGAYTRENCPRYLKPENYAALRAAVKAGRVEIRTGTLEEVAKSYPDGYFSRYILLDHMDW